MIKRRSRSRRSAQDSLRALTNTFYRGYGLSIDEVARLGHALANGQPSSTWSQSTWSAQALLWGFLDLAVDQSGNVAARSPQALRQVIAASSSQEALIPWLADGMVIWQSLVPDSPDLLLQTLLLKALLPKAFAISPNPAAPESQGGSSL